jgi:predicted nucleotidyltransferase
MIYTLDDLRKKITPIAQKYDIRVVYIFGSYARNEAGENSDVDILFQRKGSKIVGWMIGALYEDLTKVLVKNFDLVTIETLEQENTKKRSPWFVENLMNEKCLIYAKQ